MGKLVEIEDCTECPHYSCNEYGPSKCLKWVRVLNDEVKRIDGFPDFCKFPDTEKKASEA